MKKSFSTGDLTTKQGDKNYSLIMKMTHRQLSSVEASFSSLIRDFMNFTVQMNSSSRINRDLVHSLDDFCNNETSCLKDGIHSVCDSLSQMEVLDVMLSNTLKSKVVDPLSQYSQTCTNQRRQLEKISLLHGKAEAALKKEKRLFKSDKESISTAKQNMLQIVKELEGLHQKLHAFEKDKVKDLKSILSQYIHGSLVYHAKALEVFTKAYHSLEGINIDEHLEQFTVASSPQEERHERLRIVRTHSLSFLPIKK